MSSKRKINPDFEGLFVLDTIANQFIKENEILNLKVLVLLQGLNQVTQQTEREIMNEVGLQVSQR